MIFLSFVLVISNVCLIFYIVVKNKNNVSDYNSLKTERDNLLIEKTRQEEIINSRNIDIKKLSENNNEQLTKIDDLNKQLNKVVIDNKVLEDQNNKYIEELEKRKDYYDIKSNNEVLQSKLQQQDKDIQKLKEEMSTNFKNISNNIIQEQGENFKKTQRDIFSAFQNEVKQFISKVEENTKTNNINKTAFEEQMKILSNKSENLAKEANDLTTALKGNKKIQGNWGETQLEKLFEMNGWIEGIDYTKQETTHNEEGNTHRPDFIINLPDNRRVVVDSKVSLANYINYVEAENKEEKEKYLKNYVNDIKNHIKGLSSKEYQKELKAESLDYVFMYMPLEHAYIDAVSFDNSIYSEAFENKIAIVTFSSLLPIIKAINNLWNIERQNKNTKQIVKTANDIYNRVVSFQEDMNKIGDILKKANNLHEEANKKLYYGNNNVYRLTERMKQYGINTNKQLKNIDDAIEEENGNTVELFYNEENNN